MHKLTLAPAKPSNSEAVRRMAGNSGVQLVWDFVGHLPKSRERVLPRGSIELVFSLGEQHRRIDSGVADKLPTTCISGIQLIPRLLEAPAGIATTMGIRLHPLTAYAVLGIPLSELTNQIVDLTDVAGSGISAMKDRLSETTSAEQRARIVLPWITGRLQRSTIRPSPAIAWVERQIEQHQGAVSIAALRSKTGLSKFRLSEMFRREVGITPKLYARILRFQHAIALLKAGADLVGAADKSGYFDQSHMHADISEFSGLTPRGYRQASILYPASDNLLHDGTPKSRI
jgi:AraC-like DNA-binding protein